jgi:rhodanese-related sulfurtransferase
VMEVLPANEYREDHIPDASNIPLRQLNRETAAALDPKRLRELTPPPRRRRRAQRRAQRGARPAALQGVGHAVRLAMKPQ